MVLSSEVTAQIKEVLEKHPEGLSITDLVRLVDINRNTAGRYLENLLLSGQVEMRRLGMAKMYTLAKRLPVSSVLSMSSELVMQIVHHQRIIYANDKLLTFLGASAKDLFGKNLEFTPFAVVFEDVYPELLDRFRRGLKGEEWHGELSRPVQGRSFFCRVAPTVSNEGTKGVSVLLEDITDQKRDEVRIRQSETRLRSIFTVSPVGIAMAANRTFLEVNDRFCQITGYSPAELVGKSARMLYPSAEVFEEIGTTYMRQIRESGSSSTETQWVRKDGTIIDIQLAATALDPANISGGITFTALDVTESRRAERALRESESTARALLNAPTDTIILLDNRGVILDLNETALLRLAGKREDVVGILSDTVLPPDLAQERRRKISEVFTTRKPVRFTDEHRGTWFDNVAYPILDNQGNVARLAIIARDITDQKRAEAALRESEEKYRHLVEQSLQGLTILQDGRPVFANSAMLDISGYSHEEYLALSAEGMMATVHPEDRHRIGTVNADRLAGKKFAAENEFRILRKDGETRWVLTHGALISYRGTPAIQITYFDITDRKLAEQALLESEARLRQITETLTSVFYVHERVSNRFIYVSPAYEKIWKRSRQSLYDDPYTYLEAVHPHDKPRLLESIRTELEGSGYVDTDYRIMQPDGTIRWIHSKNFPVFDAHGSVYRVAGIAEDITSRRAAEDALRESEEKYRHVVEQSLQGLTIIQDDRHVYANAAMLEIVGYSDEEYLALRPEELLAATHPEDRESVAAVMSDNIRGKIPSGKAEFRILRRDGGTRWVLARGSRVTFDGRPALQVVFFDLTDRRQAEQALLESEEKFRSIVDTTVSGIGIHQDGIIRYINPSGVRILGYAGPEDIVGRHVMDFVAPRFSLEVRGRMDSLGSGMAPVDIEEFVRKDGTHVDVEVTGAPFRYNGKPAVLVVFSDITKRKLAEDALRESEDRYRKLVEISPNAVLLHRDGKVIYANRALARILGTEDADDFLGKNVLDLIHPADREAIRTNIAHDLKGTPTPFMELRMIRADGSLVFVEGQGVGTTIEGKPAVLVAINDITGRYQAGQVLKESEERYRNLAESSQDLIFVIGRDDRVEYVNSYAAAMLGLHPDQVIGKKRSSLFPGETGERQAQGLRRVFETGKAGRSEGPMEIFGTIHWYDHHLMPIMDAQGRVTSVMGVSRDITDRRQDGNTIPQGGH